MDISGNSLNQPVSFYTKNMANNINTIIEKDNQPFAGNIFAPEFATEKTIKSSVHSRKKKRNKRLNTLDNEYLPDEAAEVEEEQKEETDNFFIEKKQNNFSDNAKKAIEHFVTTTPLINYYYMKQKKQDIEQTVETLNNINQNVDELLNTAVPFGEAAKVYNDIASNLTKAANILGKANKKTN